MSDLVLTPQTIIARWANSSLVVHASGHEGGVADVVIHRRSSNGRPPEFQVTGRMAPFAGLFPYGVTCVFDLPNRPDEITVFTENGTSKVPVT